MNLEELTAAVSAVSERYASAHGIRRTEEWGVLKLAEEVGELTRAHLKKTGQARVSAAEQDTLQREYENELADVLGQLLVLAALSRVDIGAALDRKWLRWHPDRMSPADYASALTVDGRQSRP